MLVDVFADPVAREGCARGRREGGRSRKGEEDVDLQTSGGRKVSPLASSMQSRKNERRETHHRRNELSFLLFPIPHRPCPESLRHHFSSLDREVVTVLEDPLFPSKDVPSEVKSGVDREYGRPVDCAMIKR